MSNKETITKLLNKWSLLNESDKNNIVKQLYPELKRIASIQLNKNNKILTQNTTDIVNEAYIKLIDQNSMWENKNHFLSISATVMRRVIVDLTRKKISQKKGGAIEHLNIDDIQIPVPFSFTDWIVLNDAIEELHLINPILTKIVEMRVIMGMTIPETASILDISSATVSRHWKFSKAWLSAFLTKS